MEEIKFTNFEFAPVQGTNNGTIKVTVPKHTGSLPRKGTLKVISVSGKLIRTSIINQNAAALFLNNVKDILYKNEDITENVVYTGYTSKIKTNCNKLYYKLLTYIDGKYIVINKETSKFLYINNIIDDNQNIFDVEGYITDSSNKGFYNEFNLNNISVVFGNNPFNGIETNCRLLIDYSPITDIQSDNHPIIFDFVVNTTKPYLSLSTNEIESTDKGGIFSFNISTNSEWLIEE